MEKGADIQYSDPYFSVAPKTRRFNFDLISVDLSPENINSFDLVVLATDHDNFDYNLILKESQLILDTRGKFLENDNIKKA